MDPNSQPITDALQTKCSTCGGFMQDSPAAENLKCVYCGNITELDKTAAEIVENDFHYWKDRADKDAGNDMVEAAEIRCKQCGAITSLPPNVSGGKCAFCGTPLIMNEMTIKRFWQPNYLLPFKITDKQGGKNFAAWLSKRWLAPSKLKKSAISHDSFKGVYLPFWTYDANTITDYTGERGINRTVNYTNSQGKPAKRIETQWSMAHGRVAVVFDDVVVPASQTLPNSISNRLTNWDMANCIAFRKEFLAGFITEIYKRDFRECLSDAKKIMDQTIESTIRKDIGGDKQRINSKSTMYNDLKFKHLLLPVWISAFKYNDKIYQFVVNGRTGQIIGNYPKSTAKIIYIILAVIAILGTLIYFIN